MLPGVTVDPKRGRLFKGPDHRLKLPFMGFKRRGSLAAKGRGVGGSFVIDGFGFSSLRMSLLPIHLVLMTGTPNAQA